MKKLPLIVILISTLAFYGQISSELADIVPSSPSVNSFKKQTDFPIDKFTGLPTINYNIYDTSIDELNLAVSLSYHASGLRVTEKASGVGLGWNLNTGGVINRSVRGSPDDLETGYIADGGHKLDMERFMAIENNLSGANEDDINFFKNFQDNVLNGVIDVEPDIFSFNALGGVSGKFVFKPNGEIVLLNKQDVLIEGNPSIGFTITDAKGNKYLFNNTEAEYTEVFPKSTIINGITSSSSLGEDYGYVSSWKLSKIITYLGNEAVFSYISSEQEAISIPVEKINFRYNCIGLPSTMICEEITKSFSETLTFISEKIITNISFKNGSIDFNYTSFGYPLGNKLTSIIVMDSNSNVIQENNFGYSSFVNESGTGRLLLESAQKVLGNLTIPKTIFEYYTPSFPEYNSKSVDLWGFYNGKQNSSYISKSEVPISFLAYGGQYVSQMANRNPDFNSTRNGVLKSVLYPTGGKTEYIYEQNDYGYVKGYAVPSSTNSTDIEYHSEEVTNLVSCTEPYGQDITGCENTSNLIINCSNSTFPNDTSLTENFGYNVKTFVAPSSFGNYFFIYANGDGQGDATASFVRLTDSSGNIIYNYQNNNGSTFPTQTDPIISSNEQNGDPNIVILNEGETYTLIANTDDDCRGAYISIHNLVVDSPPSSFINPKVGGLRIKEISKYGSDNTLKLKRTYEYKIAQDSVRSSGVVKATHVSKTNIKNYNDVILVGTVLVAYPFYKNWSISSIPKLNYGNTKGSHVTYRRVTEYLEDYTNNTSQKIINNYTSPSNYQADDFMFDFTTRIDFDYRMGLQTKEEFKNESNTIVKEKESEYKFISNTLSESIIGLNFQADDFYKTYPGTPFLPIWDLVKNEKYYHQKLRLALIDSTNVKLLQENINITEKFHYNNSNSSLLTKTETTDSKGEVTTTEIFYPEDVITTTSLSGSSLSNAQYNAIDSLKDIKSNGQKGQHRIATPIQTETYKNGVLLNRSRVNFKDWGLNNPNTGNIISQESVETSKGTPSLQSQIIYHDYDDNGNPLEVSKTDGTHIAYIWGYNKQYPIAKIENATYGQISGFVSNLQNLSDLDISETTEGNLRTALNNFRNESIVENAMVTTYTYDPLIGVTSITDPKGYTIYYSYDAFNRLEFVKDADGNILSKNQYHYKDQ